MNKRTSLYVLMTWLCIMAHALPFFSLAFDLPVELSPTGKFVASSRLTLHLAYFATTLTIYGLLF
jgi:hypothetical protein